MSPRQEVPVRRHHHLATQTNHRGLCGLSTQTVGSFKLCHFGLVFYFSLVITLMFVVNLTRQLLCDIHNVKTITYYLYIHISRTDVAKIVAHSWN